MARMLGLLQRPARHLHPEVHAARQAVQRLRSRLRPHDEAGGVVVAEIGADAAQGMHHRDAEAAEQLRRADARDLQQPGGIDGAGGEDDLAPGHHLLRRRAGGGDVADAGGALALEQDGAGPRIGADLEIGAGAGRLEEGGARRETRRPFWMARWK